MSPQDQRRPPERPWQIAVAFLGGAAGLGLFLVGLGAAVMWVRLDAVGLPAELGVSVVPKQTLALVAVHRLVEPLVLIGLSAAAVIYVAWRKTLDGDDERPGRRDDGDDGDVDVQDRMTRNARRVLLAFIALDALLLIVLPFEWFTVALGLAYVLFLIVSYEVLRGFLRDSISLRAGAWAIAVSFALLATVPALAGEADKPSRLQGATVFLTSGRTRTGYFVGEDETAVYLGEHRAIIVIPRTQLDFVRVTPSKRPRAFSGPRPLIVRAYDTIF